jgi:hypothetical protein
MTYFVNSKINSRTIQNNMSVLKTHMKSGFSAFNQNKRLKFYFNVNIPILDKMHLNAFKRVKISYNIINANNSDLDAINRTIREFKNYSGTVTQNIMKDLILLRDLCNNSKIKETNKLLTAIDGFNFNVNVTPFIEYMGERFPWSSLDGVEFTIYRDGAVEYRVSK